MRPKESTAAASAIGRAGDGGPAVLAVLQVGAREGRGEGVLEVGFGADFGQVPLRELAAQEEAEALAEDQAAAALADFRAGAAAQIEQEHLASRRAKRSTVSSSPPGCLSAIAVTRRVQLRVRWLQGEPRTTNLQNEIFGRDRQQLFAGLSAGCRESLRNASIRARVLGCHAKPDYSAQQSFAWHPPTDRTAPP